MHRFCAILAITLCVTASASAQSVDLSLALDRATVALGEPVVAHVVIRNTSGDTIELPAALEPQYGQLRFFVRGPSSENERLFQPWATLENERTQRLGPGGRLLVTARIFFGASGWTFASPGDYSIRVALGNTSSSPVALRVSEAATEVERSLGRSLLGSEEAGLFMLLEGGDHLEQGVAVLRAVAQGQGVLAGYANFALGASQARRFANLRTGSIRPANPAQAQQLLQRSRTMLPSQSIFFQVQSQERLVEVLRLQGNTAAADKLQLQLQQNLKENILKQNLSPALREFAERSVK